MSCNVRQSMNTETIIFLGRVRLFAGRTRDYYCAYRALEKPEEGGGKAIDGKEEIEKMRKICKTHGNIVGMDPGFIDRQ